MNALLHGQRHIESVVESCGLDMARRRDPRLFLIGAIESPWRALRTALCSMQEARGMEEHEAEIPEPVELPAVGEDDDAPLAAPGLGAIGQLAIAVSVVLLLIVVFIGASAAVRRIFG